MRKPLLRSSSSSFVANHPREKGKKSPISLPLSVDEKDLKFFGREGEEKAFFYNFPIAYFPKIKTLS